MRKKIVVAMMVAAMGAMAIGSSAIAAEAVEETATEISTEGEDEVLKLSYEDIDQDVYDGAWVPTGLGFDLYLPVEWNVIDVSMIEGAEESGAKFSAVDTSTGWKVVVSANDLGADVDGIYDELSKTDGYDGVMVAEVNGIPCVTFDYDNGETKTSGLAFADADGVMYTVQCGPADDDEFKATAFNILESVSETAYEMAETEGLTE